MPIFKLGPDIVFPDPRLTHPAGILAIGGDLSVPRLLEAYRNGIFPWPTEDLPLGWWSPTPRFVLFPAKLRVTDSTERLIAGNRFHVTFDRDFPAVIRGCKTVPRRNHDGTWITDDMEKAYIALHRAGYAHSVEVWDRPPVCPDAMLVGGLYGVHIGACFSGESMFAIKSNASKVGFVTLARRLFASGFTMIDCQTPSNHLASFGAECISRSRFLSLLKVARDTPILFCNNE